MLAEEPLLAVDAAPLVVDSAVLVGGSPLVPEDVTDPVVMLLDADDVINVLSSLVVSAGMDVAVVVSADVLVVDPPAEVVDGPVDDDKPDVVPAPVVADTPLVVD